MNLHGSDRPVAAAPPRPRREDLEQLDEGWRALAELRPRPRGEPVDLSRGAAWWTNLFEEIESWV